QNELFSLWDTLFCMKLNMVLSFQQLLPNFKFNKFYYKNTIKIRVINNFLAAKGFKKLKKKSFNLKQKSC
ncbi:hypothetical protein BGV10_18930, partial [Clostridioides difficile]